MTLSKLRIPAAIGILVIGYAMPAHAVLAITWGATTNVHCSGGVCVSTNSDAVLGVKDVQKRLAYGNLTIVADSLANDVVVDAPFGWANAHNLELFAPHSIRVNRTVDVAGTGGLTLTSNDGHSDGTLSFGPKGNIHFWGTSNVLTINYVTYALVGSLPGLISAIAAHPTNRYALTAGYDASADGTYRVSPITTYFTGTLEGLGNTISNLKVRPNGSNTSSGLFDQVAPSGTVADIKIAASQFWSHFGAHSGGITTTNAGLIVGSLVQGTFIGGNAIVGGIAGVSSGTVRDCHADVSLTDDGGHFGGIVGNNSPGSLVEDSSSKGVLTGTSTAYGGGAVGSNSGIVRRTWSSAAVTVGNTTGINHLAAGGLVGVDANQLSATTIADSYATGSVTGGTDTWIGGLIGTASYSGTVSSSYSTGAVSGGAGSLVGGFIGAASATPTMSDDYWDTDTSGISDPSRGAGNVANAPGITGLTSVQLKSGLPAGFSSAVWAEDPSIHGRLPYLLSNPPL